jgi:peptidoglycan/LPS O-acetylase OafA/YrhL
MQELDLLRLGASLMVMCAHYFSGVTAHNRQSLAHGAIYRYDSDVERFATLGLLGVDVFFMISGFVIALSAEGRSARDFLVARLARILPAFWLCCLLTFTFISLDPAYRMVTAPQLLANMLFVARPMGFEFVDAVYWSLVIELRFYLMVALVIALGLYRHYGWLLLGWLGAALFEEFGRMPGMLRFLLIPQYAHFFIAGGALFMIRQRRQSGLAWLLLIASLALGVVRAQAHLSSVRADLGWAPAAVVLIAAAILWLAATGRSAGLGRPWMMVAGALTYPLYLIHEDLGFMFLRHVQVLNSPLYTTLCAMVLFFAVAHLIARGVERPAIAWVRRRWMPPHASVTRALS